MKIETSMYLIHFYISNVVFAKKKNAKTRLFSFSKLIFLRLTRKRFFLKRHCLHKLINIQVPFSLHFIHSLHACMCIRFSSHGARKASHL